MAAHLAGVFERDIAPVLTPLAFDPGRPLPFLANRSMNVAVTVTYQGRTRFARVSVPTVLPRFIALPEALSPNGQTFVMLEDVVCANIDGLFLGGTVEGAHLFRVVRDADLELDQADAEDLLQTVEGRLKQLRHGPISTAPARGRHAARACGRCSSKRSASRRTKSCSCPGASASATGRSSRACTARS